MAQDFYPFVDNGSDGGPSVMQVRHPARIAVYDDAAAAPRVVVVEPKDVREYLEEITLQVTQLASSQGGTIPFMVIREIVENFIHAFFIEPTISILDHGNTIRFSDQGPGIAQKDRALQYGTTSATEEMRRYIRGVGSGLPYVHQYMVDKGGSLKIDDNISGGTVVTISTMQQSIPASGIAPAQGGYYEQWPPYAQQQMPPQGSQMSAGAWQGWPANAGWNGFAQGGSAPLQGWPPQQPSAQGTAWGGVPSHGASPQQAPARTTPNQGMYPQAIAPQAAEGLPQSPYATSQPSWPTLTVRGRTVLDFLATHDAVGPSDLARAYGESQPTWTRELQSLEEAGLIRKDGQKRRLTAMGQAFINQTRNPQSF